MGARFYGDRWIGSFHTVIVFTQGTGVVSPSDQAIYLEDGCPTFGALGPIRGPGPRSTLVHKSVCGLRNLAELRVGGVRRGIRTWWKRSPRWGDTRLLASAGAPVARSSPGSSHLTSVLKRGEDMKRQAASFGILSPRSRVDRGKPAKLSEVTEGG